MFSSELFSPSAREGKGGKWKVWGQIHRLCCMCAFSQLYYKVLRKCWEFNPVGKILEIDILIKALLSNSEVTGTV